MQIFSVGRNWSWVTTTFLSLPYVDLEKKKELPIKQKLFSLDKTRMVYFKIWIFNYVANNNEDKRSKLLDSSEQFYKMV